MALKLSIFACLLALIPYVTSQVMISNCIELQNMKNNLAGNYALTGDIDCLDTVNWNGGQGFEPVGRFTGIFDGRGKTVFDLTISRPDYPCGLFSFVEYAHIKNVTLVRPHITGRTGGALVAYGTFYEDPSEVIIEYVGVIDAVVNAINYVGGIIGVNAAILNNSYSIAQISGSFEVGGLTGDNPGKIINSYADTVISVSSHTGGGVAGRQAGSTINTYSTSIISGTSNKIGGLIGFSLSAAEITHSFWDTEKSGLETSAGGTGKTTEQMHKHSTFSKWDFKEVWWINKTYDYPRLRFSLPEEYPPIKPKSEIDWIEVLSIMGGALFLLVVTTSPWWGEKCLDAWAERRRKQDAMRASLLRPEDLFPSRNTTSYPTASSNTATSSLCIGCGGRGSFPPRVVGQGAARCNSCGGTGYR